MELSIKNESPYDLIVCGGGPSGFPAAISAARRGLKVLLIEQSGQCGGTGTSSGVSHLLGCRKKDNSKWVVAGILKEVVERLSSTGGAIHPESIHCEEGAYSPHGWTGKISDLTYGVPFDPHAMAALLDEMLIEAKVDVMYFTHFIDVVCANQNIKSIIVHNKSGLLNIPTRSVVDATGDADVAARAGCPTVKGREEDQLMTPATLMFHIDGVNEDKLSEYIASTGENRLRSLITELRARGIWTFPYEIFITVKIQLAGTYMVNTSRLCDVDGTDGRSISMGMMRGRRESIRLMDIMRRYFPGFEQAKIKMIAPTLGVRETRRIIGKTWMTVQDVFDCKKFDDTIAWSSYGFDLPDPKQPSHQPREGQTLKQDCTPIPYGTLIPKGIHNLICAGRSISVERDVLGPIRVMGPCYGMGHAAGLAVVQALKYEQPLSQIDTSELRRELQSEGAIVDIH